MDEVPPIPAEKKGIPVVGWVGIGCGSIVLIAVMVISLLIGWCAKKVGDLGRNPEKTAAELMVKMNPDVEKVSNNDVTGEMTIRTKDGREAIVRYKDLAHGAFGFTDSARFGQSDMSQIPTWVPRVPESKIVHSAFQRSDGGRNSGMYSVTSGGTVDSLDEFFKSEAAKLGFNSSSQSSFSANGVQTRSASYSGGGRKIEIVITRNPDEDVQVNVGYEERK